MERKTKKHINKAPDVDRTRKGAIPEPVHTIRLTPYSTDNEERKKDKKKSKANKKKYLPLSRIDTPPPQKKVRTKEEITLDNIQNEEELGIALRTIITAGKKIDDAQAQKKYQFEKQPTKQKDNTTSDIARKIQSMSVSGRGAHKRSEPGTSNTHSITRKDKPNSTTPERKRKLSITQDKSEITTPEKKRKDSHLSRLMHKKKERTNEPTNKPSIPEARSRARSRSTSANGSHESNILGQQRDTGIYQIQKRFPLSDQSVRLSRYSFKRDPSLKRERRGVHERKAMNERAKEFRLPSSIAPRKQLYPQPENE